MVLVPLLNSQTSKSNGDKQTAASPAWLELNPISVPQPMDKSHRKASILTATQNNTKSKGSFISNGVFLAGWIGKKTSGFWFWYYFFPHVSPPQQHFRCLILNIHVGWAYVCISRYL